MTKAEEILKETEITPSDLKTILSQLLNEDVDKYTPLIKEVNKLYKENEQLRQDFMLANNTLCNIFKNTTEEFGHYTTSLYRLNPSS